MTEPAAPPFHLIEAAEEPAIAISPVARTRFETWRAGRSERVRAWIETSGFLADPGTFCLVPGEDGSADRLLAGADDGEPGGFFTWGALAEKLPARSYRLDDEAASDAALATRVALGWALGSYRFDRYRNGAKDRARLVWPAGADRGVVERTAAATYLVRDLINTPTADMGPGDLADAAEALAESQGASCTVIAGADLLDDDYPAIHAVGRAAALEGARAPRLVDLRWGDEAHPRVSLVGKGVCFDTGGLDLKPAAAMKLMKKDMGGAANVLGLASMIMAADLPVRLRVLIPAVENSVSGDAMRPLDVVPTRKGLTIEIGHTDAEGRVILADALAEADSENPALLVDCATLTGAARVALGPDVPAVFSNDDDAAEALVRHAAAEGDPLWRLPLFDGYRKMIDGKTADLTNSAESGYAGAITAALFLREFVSPSTPWVHLDMMAWNTTSRPGRPEGGEAMGMRALFALIADKFGSAA